MAAVLKGCPLAYNWSDMLQPDENHLTEREREVVCLLRANSHVPAVARGLCISPYTVRSHLRSIFKKMRVHSQSELLERLR